MQGITPISTASPAQVFVRTPAFCGDPEIAEPCHQSLHGARAGWLGQVLYHRFTSTSGDWGFREFLKVRPKSELRAARRAPTRKSMFGVGREGSPWRWGRLPMRVPSPWTPKPASAGLRISQGRWEARWGLGGGLASYARRPPLATE